MGKFLPVLLVVLFCQISRSQEEVRQFTNKDGQQIKAALLEVSPDLKNMKIRREDGAEFETEIVALSLDDQQYIKDWMENRPSKSDFRLDVSVSKKLIESVTHPYSTSTEYKLVQDDFGYEITIRNLSRETLENPTVSYQIVREEGVRIIETDDEGWSYAGYNADPENIVVQDSLPLEESLVFNRDTTVTTNPIRIERVVFDAATMYGDDLFGILVRVMNAQGDLVTEIKSPGKEIQALKWEDAEEFRQEGSPNPRRNREADDSMNGPASYSLQKGDSVEGPTILDEKPISISAEVEPAPESDGSIVSIGGGGKGLSLYIEDRYVVATQSIGGERKSLKVKQPLGNFKVGVNLTADSLELLVDDVVVDQSESRGLFRGAAANGIEVGTASEPTVGEYEAPFPFAGAIRDVTVVIGN